jgi:hypothetical protein
MLMDPAVIIHQQPHLMFGTMSTVFEYVQTPHTPGDILILILVFSYKDTSFPKFTSLARYTLTGKDMAPCTSTNTTKTI